MDRSETRSSSGSIHSEGHLVDDWFLYEVAKAEVAKAMPWLPCLEWGTSNNKPRVPSSPSNMWILRSSQSLSLDYNLGRRIRDAYEMSLMEILTRGTQEDYGIWKAGAA